MNLKELQLQGAQSSLEKHMQLRPACLSWASALPLLGTFTPTLMGMQPLEVTTLTVGWDWL